jgi:thioredoxin reductase
MTEVAIVGAGPYGLSIASYLSHLGVAHRIFGKPMQAWQDMYVGMGLKSQDSAVSVYTPEPGYTFIEYCRAHGKDLAEPVAITLFAEYGLWAQQRLVPELEKCLVSHIGTCDGGFEVTLETGERVLAGQVVMATGLTHWKRIPHVFEGIADELVSHTSRQRDLAEFRGMDVAVIGAGQSALEAATLLHERGARPQLLVRGGPPAFSEPPADSRSLKERLLYRPSKLGPGKLNFLLDRAPTAAHHLLSDERRVRLTRTHLGPLGAWWLRPRFDGNVPVQAGCEIVDATESGSRLRLELRRADGTRDELHTDHLICGTGYEVDVDRHTVLDPAIKRHVRRIERAPRLTRHFETSVPGLYFVGNGAAFSFGPLCRFVAGASYTAPALTRHLARVARSRNPGAAAVNPVPRPPAGATGRSV